MTAALVAGLAPAPVLGASPTVSADAVSIDEDDGARTITLTADDPDDQAIDHFSITTPPAKGSLGTVSDPVCLAPGDPCTATVDYTPATDANGDDSFGFTATDVSAETSVAGTVAITIDAVNDEPSFTKGADQTVGEGALAQTVVGWATDLDAGPADEIGQTLAFVLDADLPALFSAQPAVAADGTLTFTPAADAYGTATVDVYAQDSGGIGNGGDNRSATQAFSITIDNVNDPPNAVDDGATVNEDSGPNNIDVLANDEYVPDPAETLTVTAVGAAGKGTAAVGSAGAYVTYTPYLDATGADSFAYTIRDDSGDTDTATVTITITADNDPPVATGDARTVLEDSGANTINVLANDTDLDGDSLTITGVGAAPKGSTAIVGGTSVTYTPDQDANGSDSFTYTISDGNGGTATATVSITITLVNDAPILAIGGNQSVAEDAGAESVGSFATKGPGAANESAQATEFHTSNDNTALFSSQPAVFPPEPSPTPPRRTPTAWRRCPCTSPTTAERPTAAKTPAPPRPSPSPSEP